MTPYEKYCSEMKARGLKPTLSEPQLLEAWGIKPKEEVHIPFIARKSSSHKNVKPTLSEHEKKLKAPRIPRKGWSEEQKRARRAENMKRSRENRNRKILVA